MGFEINAVGQIIYKQTNKCVVYALGGASVMPLICRWRSHDERNGPGRAIGSTDATSMTNLAWILNSRLRRSKPRLSRPSTGACRGLRSRTTTSSPAEIIERYPATASICGKQNRVQHVIPYRENLARTGYGSIETTMRRRRILFAGFITRMEKGRLRKNLNIWGDRGCGGRIHLRREMEKLDGSVVL